MWKRKKETKKERNPSEGSFVFVTVSIVIHNEHPHYITGWCSSYLQYILRYKPHNKAKIYSWRVVSLPNSLPLSLPHLFFAPAALPQRPLPPPRIRQCASLAKPPTRARIAAVTSGRGREIAPVVRTGRNPVRGRRGHRLVRSNG